MVLAQSISDFSSEDTEFWDACGWMRFEVKKSVSPWWDAAWLESGWGVIIKPNRAHSRSSPLDQPGANTVKCSPLGVGRFLCKSLLVFQAPMNKSSKPVITINQKYLGWTSTPSFPVSQYFSSNTPQALIANTSNQSKSDRFFLTYFFAIALGWLRFIRVWGKRFFTVLGKLGLGVGFSWLLLFRLAGFAYWHRGRPFAHSVAIQYRTHSKAQLNCMGCQG